MDKPQLIKKPVLLVYQNEAEPVLYKYLKFAGFDILKTDSASIDNAIALKEYDLSIVDYKDGEIGNLEYALRLHRIDPNRPVMVMTSLPLSYPDIHRLRGEAYKSGADDFICRPYDADELIYRIRVFLKWSYVRLDAEVNPVMIGSYEFDKIRRTLTHNGLVSTLTDKQTRLLKVLYKNLNHLTPKYDLFRELWLDETHANAKALDVYVNWLRDMLKADTNIELRTEINSGYILMVKSLN